MINKFIEDLQRARDKKLGVVVLNIETAEEVLKVLETYSGVSSLERGPSRAMLKEQLEEAVRTIDNLVAANEAVHRDEIGTQVRLGEEKHRNEELELKILDLEKQIETLKTK